MKFVNKGSGLACKGERENIHLQTDENKRERISSFVNWRKSGIHWFLNKLAQDLINEWADAL